MLTFWTILGWSVGAGITLTACIALVEWIARRDERQRLAQDHRRATLDRIVTQHPSQPFHRPTNGSRQP